MLNESAPFGRKLRRMVTAAMKSGDSRFLAESYDKPSVLKSRDFTFPTKVHMVKVMVLCMYM